MWKGMSHVVIIAMLEAKLQHQLSDTVMQQIACRAYTKLMCSSASRSAEAYTSSAVCLHCAFFAVDQVLPVNTSTEMLLGSEYCDCS